MLRKIELKVKFLASFLSYSLRSDSIISYICRYNNKTSLKVHDTEITKSSISL